MLIQDSMFDERRPLPEIMAAVMSDGATGAVAVEAAGGCRELLCFFRRHLRVGSPAAHSAAGRPYLLDILAA